VNCFLNSIDNTLIPSQDKDALQNYFRTITSLIQNIKIKLSQTEERNTSHENELSRRQEEILRLSALIEELKEEIKNLESEIQEKCNEIESLNSKLEETGSEIARTSENVENAEKNIIALKKDIRILTEEKTAMEAQVVIDREQLEQANEGRIKAECSQAKTEEELKNLRCLMDQEVAALKFQLSSETMKFEEEIKVQSHFLRI